jgi:hypothetical protein
MLEADHNSVAGDTIMPLLCESVVPFLKLLLVTLQHSSKGKNMAKNNYI